MRGDLRLVTAAEAFQLLSEAPPFPDTLVTKLSNSLTKFHRIIPDDGRHFTLRDVMQVSGWGEATCYRYVSCLRVLRPSVRDFTGRPGRREALFSWFDLFCAGVQGMLWRHRLPVDVLRKVQPLLLGGEKNQAEQPIGTAAQPSN